MDGAGTKAHLFDPIDVGSEAELTIPQGTFDGTVRFVG